MSDLQFGSAIAYTRWKRLDLEVVAKCDHLVHGEAA